MRMRSLIAGAAMLALVFAVNGYGVALARDVDGGGPGMHGGDFGGHAGAGIGGEMPEHFQGGEGFAGSQALHEGRENHFEGNVGAEHHENEFAEHGGDRDYRGYRPYQPYQPYRAYRPYDHDDYGGFGLRFAWPFVYGGYGYGYPYYNGYGYYNYGYPNYGYGYNYGYPYGYTTAPNIVQPKTATDGQAYYAEAKQAFRQGNYQEALRLATHASIEMPNDVQTRQLMTLSSFALGNYGAASADAHAALSMGRAPNWSATQVLYGNPIDYTSQLRSLEAFVRNNPNDANSHFVLGYQYLMLNHPDVAETQFAAAAKGEPQDQLAEHLIQQLRGPAPALETATAPAKRAKPSGKQAKQAAATAKASGKTTTK